MRTRIITMLAALLLISTGAFAQSGETPLKGDVNEDGKVDVADINAIIKIMKDAGGTAEETEYYFYLGNNENQVISNDYTINTSSLQTYNNVEDILGNHTFDSAQYVLVPEVWYSQIKFKNAQNMPLDADVYRVNIGTTNYILIEGYESWADLLILELDPNNQGGLDAEIVDKTNYTEETTYYYYAGWTLPSTSNVDTIINETYPTSSSDNTQHPAGKKTTSKSSFNLASVNLYNSSAKTNYYVLVPTDQAIYDTVFGLQMGIDSFTSQGTITVGTQIHTIYKSVDTTRNIGSIEIK